jgi:hypothetical protein
MGFVLCLLLGYERVDCSLLEKAETSLRKTVANDLERIKSYNCDSEFPSFYCLEVVYARRCVWVDWGGVKKEFSLFWTPLSSLYLIYLFEINLGWLLVVLQKNEFIDIDTFLMCLIQAC